MRNIRCTLAYAGTRYYGWQKASDGPSIEETIQTCLEQILQHKVKLQAASRTDRGVHAKGQVINFFTDLPSLSLRRLHGSLKGLLPADISPLAVEQASDNFHPTLDNVGKEYHYEICTHSVQLPFDREFSWHYPYHPISHEKMNRGAKFLEGTHDFSAFTTAEVEDGVRTLEKCAIVPLENGRLRIEIRGDNFLYKMVRTLAGTLVHVGSGKIPLPELPSLLKEKDRKLAGMTAPAHGLTLKEVFFPDR